VIGAKRLAKGVLSPILFKYPPVGLHPERLQLWLRSVLESRDVPGDILEVGCDVCGTSAVTWSMMGRTGIRKRYLCIDTFSGFVDDQFAEDLRLGNSPRNRYAFAANSEWLARRVLAQHGAEGVELVRGDMTTMSLDRLPSALAVVLIDVDLAIPVYEALRRLTPRVSPGGVVLVDDCPESDDWQARKGYERFCTEYGFPQTYEYGLGLVRIPRRGREPSSPTP